MKVSEMSSEWNLYHRRRKRSETDAGKLETMKPMS